MSKFDIVATISRICGLYRERGLERTPGDIAEYAKAICKRQRISRQKAIEAIEDELLSSNPRPEKWE